MDFFFFVLANLALFIRPAEIAEPLATVPLYLILISLCLVASLPRMVTQWTTQSLAERPITLCVLGALAAVVLSHLSHGNLGLARWWGIDFARTVVYFLLLVCVVDSAARLRQFLIWMLCFVVAMAVLALCQYHELIHIPALEVLLREELDPATGDVVLIPQLVGTGTFNDPNDFCLILSTGILISIYLLNDLHFGILRVIWLMPLGLLSYAVILAQSRGGLLALLAGLSALLAVRIGTKKTLLLGALALPVLLSVLGGRFSRMSVGEDTAQQRIYLWRDALMLFRQAPLFGIGANTIHDEIGLVAHNSYIHSYAETGFVGGTCFVGMFALAFWTLSRLGGDRGLLVPPELRRLRPYLIGILACFVVGLYTLSRNYVVATFLPAGLAEIYQRLATERSPGHRLKVGVKMAAALAVFSMACLVGLFVFVRVFAT